MILSIFLIGKMNIMCIIYMHISNNLMNFHLSE